MAQTKNCYPNTENLQIVFDPVLARLVELEKVVERGLTSFIEVGQALAEIKQDKLYQKLGYPSFEVYCRERWQMVRMSAYRFIKAALIVKNVTNWLQNSENIQSVTNWLQNSDKSENVNQWLPQENQNVTNGLQETKTQLDIANGLHESKAEKDVTKKSLDSVLETVAVRLQKLPLPTHESQVRPLSRLSPTEQPLGWVKAAFTAPDGKITAKHVKKVVKEMKKAQYQKSQVENPPELPPVLIGDCVQIKLRNSDEELNRYNHAIGIVERFTENGVVVRVPGKELPPLFPDEVLPAPNKAKYCMELPAEVVAQMIAAGYGSVEGALLEAWSVFQGSKEKS